jgi:protein-disulfide isomerase
MSHLVPPVGIRDHSDGPADAPVTLVEFGDYECVYCGEMYPIIRSLRETMGDRLRFVFRNFPMNQAHPHAEHAAELAEAASAANRFWPMHDILFENQNVLDDASLIYYGERLRLERNNVIAALEGRYAQKIHADFISGMRSGVNGTPSLFIDGKRYDGPRDINSLYYVLTEAADVDLGD